MDDKSRLEMLLDMSGGPAWELFISELAEALETRRMGALVNISSENELFHWKGWDQCAREILRSRDSWAQQMEALETDSLNEDLDNG